MLEQTLGWLNRRNNETVYLLMGRSHTPTLSVVSDKQIIPIAIQSADCQRHRGQRIYVYDRRLPTSSFSTCGILSLMVNVIHFGWCPRLWNSLPDDISAGCTVFACVLTITEITFMQAIIPRHYFVACFWSVRAMVLLAVTSTLFLRHCPGVPMRFHTPADVHVHST